MELTPKEEAKQLYNKMKFETECNSQPSTVHGMCKKLALICVDEKIKTGIELNGEMFSGFIERLQDIKEEINKL